MNETISGTDGIDGRWCIHTVANMGDGMSKGGFIKQSRILTDSPLLRSVFEEMTHQKMTQIEMALALGKAQQRVWEWSTGKVEPGVKKVEAMAKHLGFRIVLQPIDGGE